MTAKRFFQTILLLAGLSAGAVSCGDEGQFWNPDTDYPPDIYGFRVVWSDPGYNEENVPVNYTVTVGLNEAVNQATIAGNVTMEESQNGSTLDITADGDFSIQMNGTQLLWRLKTGKKLVLGAIYQMKLGPGLMSQAGRSLISLTLVPFSTGTMTGGDVVSVPGRPVVNSIYLSSNMGYSCLTAIVTFNEYIVGLPRAMFKIGLYNFGGDPIFDGGASPLYPWVDPYDQQRFYLEFPNGACGLYGPADAAKIIIEDAVDLQGEHMARERSETFSLLYY
jgi:hypothetical protein